MHQPAVEYTALGALPRLWAELHTYGRCLNRRPKFWVMESIGGAHSTRRTVLAAVNLTLFGREMSECIRDGGCLLFVLSSRQDSHGFAMYIMYMETEHPRLRVRRIILTTARNAARRGSERGASKAVTSHITVAIC
jgi:hypothetical protein